MIIAKITQDNLELTIQEINIPYQHSQGLEIEFVRDAKYKDYTLLAFYKLEGDVEAKLMECNNDIISIAKDVFKKIGKVSFSFSLTKDKEVIHLGVVGFYVRRSFGNNDSILPQENKNTWMDIISNVAKDGVDNYWNAFYKEEIENIVNDINSKVSAASNYADQANAANAEAQKSAADASNSATSALDSSNKAQQHLNSIVEKTNTFNADYASKIDDFNTSVEQANNTLDAKISTANTDIDKKVLDANNALDTKIADANTSIDAKVTEATAQANIATTKATELKDAVDKVNYLEDVVDTKLTQPYVSSPIVENGTISDSDEGLLRNLKIYGKCTQKVEENIVPTPDRPVPIVSKKIVVSGETVELRSLKESSNLFDIKLNGFMYGLLDMYGNLNTANKNYASTDFIKVLPNTQYYSDVFGTNIISSGIFFFDINKEIVSKTDTRPFVTPSGCYYVRCGITINGTTLLEDLSIANNAFVFCKGGAINTYIPPTVRDYKIVDHTNKKSWIEMNIIQKNLEDLIPQKVEHTKFIATYVYTTKPVGKDGSWNNIFCNNFAIYPYSGFPTDIKEGIHASNYGIYVVLDDKRNVTTIEEYKEWIKDNPIIVNYQLATPTTEEIPYLESDTSEFGVSFQDSTSPSLNIPSTIDCIDKLEIKTTGINLLSNKLEHWYFRKTLGWGASTGTHVPEPNTFRDIENYSVIEINGILPNTRYSFYNADTKNLWVCRIIEMDDNYIGYFNHHLYDSVELSNKEFYRFTTTPNTTKLFLQIRTIPLMGNGASRDMTEKDITNMQTTLALGEIKEHYPYEETAITHTLKTPLVKCGDVADVIDLNNLERINNNYYGLLSFTPSKGSLRGNHISCYWNSGIMPKPKIVKNDKDKNQLICDRAIANLSCYNSDIGETISIYKDSSADFIGVFNVNRFKDSTEFKKFFVDNPTMVAYPLATPTVEPLESALVEKLKTLMSFYPITHIFSNVPIEFDYKLNLENWHKVVSGQVEDARNIIYDLTVKQNSLEVMQLENSLETQYNMDLLKLGGGI